MEEIVINISKETRRVYSSKLFLGNDGENLQTKLVFKFTDEFVDGQARIEYEQDNKESYIELEKVDETYILPIGNILMKEGPIVMQLCITQGTEDSNIPVFKSKIFNFEVGKSINAIQGAPKGYDLWIEVANAKINKMEELANSSGGYTEQEKEEVKNSIVEELRNELGGYSEEEKEELKNSIVEELKNETSERTEEEKEEIKNSITDDVIAEVNKTINSCKSEFIGIDNVKTINGQSIIGEGNIVIKSSNEGGNSETGNILDGKKILCIGDSICEGVGTTDGHSSYVYFLQQLYPNANFINLGVGGMTISKKDSSVTNCMPDRIASNEFEKIEYANPDIIIFEGGVNDMMRNVKLGEIVNGYKNKIKNSRYCDALEYMFSYFKNKFPNARMIFTSIHCLKSMDINLQAAWWELTSEECAKWSVEYCDLYSLVNANIISGLDLHPTATIHQKYYTPILEKVLLGSVAFPSTSKDFYLKNRVLSISFYSGKKTFNVGDTITTSDWRINGYRTDLTTYVNATSGCTFDTSDVDNTTAGNYPVHVSYVDNGRVLSCDVIVTVAASQEKVLNSISATKKITSSEIGASVNTSDIVVKAQYTDGTEKDVTNLSTIDESNINTTRQGEYSILISYSENGITCNTSIAYNVTENSTSEPETPEEPSTDWSDEITLTRAWDTSQVFSNTPVGRLEASTQYSIRFKGICVSNGTINGTLIFKLSNGQTKNIGTVTNNEFEVDWDFTNVNLVGNCSMIAYTTDGSGFPWTIKIKDFTVSAK